MRAEARLLSGAGCASSVSACPDGGATPEMCGVYEIPARAATARKSGPLTKGLTGLAVEEVHARDVDGDRHLFEQTQHHARRELRDEIRPRCDNALLARRHLVQLLVLALADRERVDLEIDDRLSAERLDKVDLTFDRGQVGPLRRRMEVLAAHTGDDLAAVVAAQPRIRSERTVGHGERRPAERDGYAAVDGDLRLEQVHRRRADEPADEEVGGRVVQGLRIRDLL